MAYGRLTPLEGCDALTTTKNGRALFRASVRIYLQRVRVSDALAKRLGSVGAAQLGERHHFELANPLT